MQEIQLVSEQESTLSFFFSKQKMLHLFDFPDPMLLVMLLNMAVEWAEMSLEVGAIYDRHGPWIWCEYLRHPLIL